MKSLMPCLSAALHLFLSLCVCVSCLLFSIIIYSYTWVYDSASSSLAANRFACDVVHSARSIMIYLYVRCMSYRKSRDVISLRTNAGGPEA